MALPLPPVELSRHSSCPSRFHFPASLGSTGVTPLPGYYGGSDSCRAVLRAAAALNAVRSPAGLPAYLAYAACHSVSNHPPVLWRLLVGSRFLSARAQGPAGLPRHRRSSSRSGRLGLRGGLRSALAGSSYRLAESSSRSFVNTRNLRYGLAVHLRQLPTSCRHNAVAFSHRPVNLRPDGDFHPAV